MEQVKLIQHNIIKWTMTRRNELMNIYRQYDPDIIMLNATGLKDTEKIKLYTYNVYQRNITNEEHAGIAIGIKKNIKHRIIDDNNEDILGVEIETSRGPLALFTAYIPPRHADYNSLGIMRYLRKPIPTYLVADLNARHIQFGHGSTNARGRLLLNYIRRDIITLLGPEFKTYIGTTGTGTPDMMIGNRWANLNVSLTQGPITTSDHLPIYMKIATKPIIIQGKTRLEIKKSELGQVSGKYK